MSSSRRYHIALIDVHRVNPEPGYLDTFAVWFTDRADLQQRVRKYVLGQPWFVADGPVDKWLLCQHVEDKFLPTTFAALEDVKVHKLGLIGGVEPWRETYDAVDFRVSADVEEEKHEDLVEFTGILHASSELKFDRPYCYLTHQGGKIELVFTPNAGPSGQGPNMHLGMQWAPKVEDDDHTAVPTVHWTNGIMDLIGMDKRTSIKVPLVEDLLLAASGSDAKPALHIYHSDEPDEWMWIGPNALWFCEIVNNRHQVTSCIPLVKIPTSPHQLSLITPESTMFGYDAHMNLILRASDVDHFAVDFASWKQCACTSDFSEVSLKGIGEHVYVVRQNTKGQGAIVGRLKVDHTNYP